MEADMFHPKVLKNLAPLLLLGIAAALAPAIASASYGDSANSVVSSSKVVRYHDLNLNQAEDVATLYTRIRRAAAEVCTASAASSMQRDCYQEAIATAVARVNSPSLSAYHQRRSGARTRGGV
jgi:UrcA family protein